MSTAACSSVMPAGIFTTRNAGTLRTSAYEPGTPIT